MPQAPCTFLAMGKLYQSNKARKADGFQPPLRSALAASFVSGQFVEKEKMIEIFEQIVGFLVSNYKWLFSGLGVLVLGLFFKTRSSSVNKVKQQKIKAHGDVIGRDKH